MGKKTIKVKVKKKKLKVKRIILCLLVLVLLCFFINYLLEMPIKNIYILNNKIIKDQEIINNANIQNYPSFLLTPSKEMKENILKNPYIKDVQIEKKLGNKVYITVEENRPLCVTKDTNELVLSNGIVVNNDRFLSDLPVLINDISSIREAFAKGFSKVDDDTLSKISEIEYSPVAVDQERFLLYMNDGNLVYITLTKIEKLNKYTSIYQEMEGKKGIIYLDSGDYIEVKEDPSNTNSNDENGENSNSNNNEANPNSNPETNENTQTSNNDVSEDNNNNNNNITEQE